MDNIFADFLLKKGLYDSQEINRKNINDLIQLINGQVKINCFCKQCNEMRVFIMRPIMYYWNNNSTWIEKSLSGAILGFQKSSLWEIPLDSGR